MAIDAGARGASPPRRGLDHGCLGRAGRGAGARAGPAEKAGALVLTARRIDRLEELARELKEARARAARS